jgi:uncharacterized surface protein with fasciclin (FAS1) repeats
MRYTATFSLLFIFFFNATLFGQKYLNSDDVLVETEWHGVTFSSDKSLLENLAMVPNFAETGLILENFQEKLFSEGEMYTVFVSVDSSFKALPEETYKELFGSGDQLERFFKLYVVPGRLDSYALKTAIEKNNGSIRLKTLGNEDLGVKEIDGKLVIFDSNQNVAKITDANFYHAQGFFHIIDGLVFPAE